MSTTPTSHQRAVDFDAWSKPDNYGQLYVIRYRFEVLARCDQTVIGSNVAPPRRALSADGSAAWKAECIRSEMMSTDEGSLFENLVNIGYDPIGIEVETRSIKRLEPGPGVPIDYLASVVAEEARDAD